ncbi:gamma-glutamyl-gamma-aminobutyrate hydrolase family protein [Geodermatophilus sp. URMC 64]
MTRRPVVGVTTYQETARWGVWNCPAVLLPADYVRQVSAAGGIPVLLPPLPGDAEVLDRLDALVLAGGADVDPARYGATRAARTGPAQPHRDDAELALLAGALERDLPVLGVCRGLQLLAVACGGALVQHLPDVVGTDVHVPSPGVYGDNHVRIAPGSRLAGLIGTEATWACHHHQAVERLGAGLTAVAWADDGTVEAAELDGARFVIGVQGHPEVGDDRRLFAGLVAAAGAGHDQLS